MLALGCQTAASRDGRERVERTRGGSKELGDSAAIATKLAYQLGFRGTASKGSTPGASTPFPSWFPTFAKTPDQASVGERFPMAVHGRPIYAGPSCTLSLAISAQSVAHS